MERIACAYVPRYELALFAKDDPELWRRPAAVVDVLEKPPRLRCVTPAAEQLGLYAGQPATQARALCSELDLRAPDTELLAKARHDILACLGTLAPKIDDDQRGGFFLSLAGIATLAPSEPKFAQKIRQAILRLGFPAQVAIADRPFVAWVAAQRTRTFALVPDGGDAKWLFNVPTSSLGLSAPAAELLALLGVTSAGAMLSLPPGSLGRRLGSEGVRLERLCRGEGLFVAPSATNIPSEPESVNLDLDQPMADLEPLLFICKTLIDRLVKRLAHTRRGLLELTLKAGLDDRSRLVHVIALPRPTLDAAVVLDLVRLWLESKPFASPVATLDLLASRVGAADARQLSLLRQREEMANDALARVVTRLVAAFGESAVVRPVLADSYRPEARLRWVPFDATRRLVERTAAAIDPQGYPGKVLRLIEPPTLIEWDLEAGWLRRPRQTPARVIAMQGPHRLSGEWWSSPFDRSYFWLWIMGGELVWIFRNEQDHRVYLQAVVD